MFEAIAAVLLILIISISITTHLVVTNDIIKDALYKTA
jgi:hypothetical protein